LYPFERFTDAAKKVLTAAQQEAERAHHSYIGTEHLLLGLLHVESEAQRVLLELGMDMPMVRATIENVLGRNERIIIQQIIPTSRVKRVIELSFEAARTEGSSEVAPEHILVGLLEEGQGIAAHVLQDLGAPLEKVQAARGRSGPREPYQPWPQPGDRVLVHDPEAPYRLWEGAVTAHEAGRVRVTIPDHPLRSQAEVPIEELHAVPMRLYPRCERCLFTPGPAAPAQ
jgi:hypothetical protein